MKLGLLGANGSGKSTLLRLLAGEWEPDAGTLTRAEGLRVVMFEQGRASLNLDQPLRRALCPNGETVTYGDRPIHVAAWAKRFLFRTDQLDVSLSRLSGGEQSRVRIAQLMLQPADLLLLDEPANDLDIPALEVLEESLADFPGALVLVSHDRELTHRLCPEILGLDGLGGAAIYSGVSQWLAACEAMSDPVPVKKPPSPRAAPAPVRPRKLSFQEQRELDGIEARILRAETDVHQREEAVAQASGAGHEALADACRALEEAQQTVERLYARWQELEAKRNS